MSNRTSQQTRSYAFVRNHFARVGAVVFLTVLIFGLAALLLPARAEAADAIKIDALRQSDGGYALQVTNAGTRTITSIDATTTIPKTLTARGKTNVVSWHAGAVAPGLSVMALALDGAGNPADLLALELAVSSDSVDLTSTTHLAATGSTVSVLTVAALALCLAAVVLGVCRRKAWMRRAAGAFGALSVLLGGVFVSGSASAATVANLDASTSAAGATEAVNGVATPVVLNGATYQLMSDLKVVYASTDAKRPPASNPSPSPAPEQTLTSMDYAKAMGRGWNLGNTFEAYDTGSSRPNAGGESAWGNPIVTKALITGIKAKGYKTIRMPLTLEHRYAENPDAGPGEYRYVINADWLARYKQVVDWVVEEGLYVDVDLHGDSYMWINHWDGTVSPSSVEYRKFTDTWKQLAVTFANEPQRVCFETDNEPQFASGDADGITKLIALNTAAHEVIRAVPGNEKRMIIFPTLHTNDADQFTAPARDQILGLHDPYILATVHYYSEWVYSANLGRTGFDEKLFDGQNATPRTAADKFAEHVKTNFTDHGIGTVVGEFGLLGYDAADTYLQPGEELKYYEYMNHLAQEGDFALILWDNGSAIDRRSPTYTWKNADMGTMLEASMRGRSSYSTGLDAIYMGAEPTGSVDIPLTLNNNTFAGIAGLAAGVDYTYDQPAATVRLSQAYLRSVYDAHNGYGQAATLTLNFNAGAPWHEYLVKSAVPALGVSATGATGTRTDGITVPINFKGNVVKSAAAVNDAGDPVGPNSGWWKFLQSGTSFKVDPEAGTLKLTKQFFDDSSVSDGNVNLNLTFFDGSGLTVPLAVNGQSVTVRP